MIKVTVEEYLVYDVDNKVGYDKSKGIRSHFKSIVEPMKCIKQHHDDIPSEVLLDKDGRIKSINGCCEDFEKLIQDTINNQDQ